MKVIGIILNVIAALWAALGVLLMLTVTEGYTMAENVLYASIFFYVPAAIVIVVGSLLVRAGNRRRRRKEHARSAREYDRRFGEGGTYDPAFADYRDSERHERYGEPNRRRDTGFAPPEPRPRPEGERYGSYREPYDSYREPYDAHREPYDSYREPYDAHREPYDSYREPYDAHREPYDSYGEAGRTTRDDFRGSGRSEPARPASGQLTEAVCRSCGSRKTMRAGTSAPCDYCGSEMIAE